MGFHDVNAALAHTTVAMENAAVVPKQKGAAIEEISSLLKVAFAERNQTLKGELQADILTLMEDILTKSHTYTDIMTQDLRAKTSKQVYGFLS